MNNSLPTQAIFTLVLARLVVDETGRPVPEGLLHLWWSTAEPPEPPQPLESPRSGEKLVQVYVDGRLVEVSQDSAQRELFLLVDTSRPHRIELLAVAADDPAGAWQAHPELLQSWNPAVRTEAALGVWRDERLPVDTELTVRVDGREVDRALLWPAEVGRSGFGALFGVGDFGGDAAAGPGWGAGELGMGPLGSDGAAWHWRRHDLPPGNHVVEITAADAAGRPVAAPVLRTALTLDALPTPAQTVALTPDFTLHWTA